MRTLALLGLAVASGACGTAYTVAVLDGGTDASSDASRGIADASSDGGAPNADGAPRADARDVDVFDAGVNVVPADASCIRFEACVDGTDDVMISGATLSVTHVSFDPIGTNSACAGVTSTVNPNASLYADGGVIAIDGVAVSLGSLPVTVQIDHLTGFHIVSARGTVSLTAPNTVELNDNLFGGAAPYVVDLCR
jgi:hypothetical protein